MDILDLIEKKKHNKVLTKDEINFFVEGTIRGDFQDYQITAFLMSLYFSHLNIEETTFLTEAFVKSGDVLDLSAFGEGKIIDKHSSGGVGDKITLMFLPLVASLGYKVAKLSGRGLGHTGGTIDKLESIPGFRTCLSNQSFINQMKEISLAIASQTKSLCPADGKIYALRDVTSTVDIDSLIASSIVSKKIASGADFVVLDVKFGSGAFIKTFSRAKKLAETMVEVAKRLNKKIIAVVSDMNMPLGRAVGNSLEVIEAIEFLKGNMEQDLKEITFSLVKNVLMQTNDFESEEDIDKKLNQSIKNGEALRLFQKMVEFQGGNKEIVDNFDLFKKTEFRLVINAKDDSYVKNIDAFKIAKAAKILGAGRSKVDDSIDLSVGVYLNKKFSERVEKNQPIATIFANSAEKAKVAKQIVESAFEFSKTMPEMRKIVFEVVK